MVQNLPQMSVVKYGNTVLDICTFWMWFCCSIKSKNVKDLLWHQSQPPGIAALGVSSTTFSSSFSIPTQRICYLLSVRVVGSFRNVAACPWFRSFSCSSLAVLLTITHGCLVATECDISMLSLKRLFSACSQCQPPPPSPTDLDTVFFLPSSFAADSAAPHILGQIDYFMSSSFPWNILSLCFPRLPLLSLYYLSITLLTSWPFNFSFACSTITCSLTEGVQGAERDVSDRAGGLTEVPCYCCSFIDKSACLSACLHGPEEHPRGAAC